MRSNFFLSILKAIASTVCIFFLMAETNFVVGQSNSEQIAEAVSAAPEILRSAATVIIRDDQGVPTILRQGNNELICEPDGPGRGFVVECYHKSFQAVMDWTYRRMSEGARSFVDMFVGGGPDADVSPGAIHYALVGPSRDEAELRLSISLPFATAESTALPVTEQSNGPWLMWAGTSAAHVMFGEIPPGIPAQYPGK